MRPASLRLVFITATKYNGPVECANCRSEIPKGAGSCPRCGWQVPDERLHFPRLNSIFAGRYDFLRLLGVGGFAEVYLARDMLLEREVAIKMLLPQHAQDPQTVERFLREAKLYAKLEHPNIIPIFDTGVLQQHVFITMKYIRGESLKHMLSHQRRIDAQLLPVIAGGVARALVYIHQQGIVHRDIKPANIIVEKATRTVYLADFGIARTDSSQTLTQTGMIVGTPHYLSPEQIQGKKIDPRSDIYALGATLYELASGQPLFQGDSPLEILYQHINERPEPLANLVPGIDPVLTSLIFRCIEKNPARRYQKAEEIVAAIERMGAPQPVASEKTTLLTASAVSPPHRKAASMLTGAVLLAAALFVVFFIWLKEPGPAGKTSTQKPPANLEQAEDKNTKMATILQGKAAPREDNALDGPGKQSAPIIQTAPEKSQDKKGPTRQEQSQKQEPAPMAVDRTTDVMPLPGTLRFSSFPPLADIYFNGEKIGNTGQVFEKNFPPGDYVFTFSIPGFQSAEVRTTVRTGETLGTHYRFPQFRSFTITAKPFGRVLVDGREYGDTPQTIKLAYGEHLVRVTKNGYLPGEQRVVIGQETKNSLYFELTKEGKK